MNQTFESDQGHWILAKMGKKVLRPGGRELTMKLIKNLSIQPEDQVVEFAPGLGFTASITLQHAPKSYTAVELNEEAAAFLKKQFKDKNVNITIGGAAQSGLPDASADKVYGEAMLTMHADHRKSEIIKEAYRILKKGGLYGIHELSLEPNHIDEPLKATIQKELAQSIKVNARPLTENEWRDLLEKEGFQVIQVEKTSMSLLELKRVIEDEGFWRTCKIMINFLLYPKERKRILEMRTVFNRYRDQLGAVSLVAKKV